MKKCKYLIYIILMVISCFSFIDTVNAKEVNVYMFYGETCPHCEEALEYLNGVKDKYDLNIIKYEVWFNSENKQIMNDLSKYLDVNVVGVPFTIIDNTPIFGYSSGITDETFRYHIKLASNDKFIDKVGIKLGIVKNQNEDGTLIKPKKTKQGTEISLFGKTKKIPNNLAIILLSLFIGCSSCVVWLLIFLAMILGELKDKKRIRRFGITYSLILSLFYVILNLFINTEVIIKYMNLFRVIITIIAFIYGLDRINKFIGDEDTKKHKKTSKVINCIKDKKIITTTILLAISSAFIFTLCTEKLQIMFKTGVELYSDFSYVFYLICSLIIFVYNSVLYLIVQKLFDYIKYKSKNMNILYLLSGVMMFLLGIIIILKPEWLIFY